MTSKNIQPDSNSSSSDSANKRYLSFKGRIDFIVSIAERLVAWVLAQLPWLPWTLFISILPGVTLWQLIHYVQNGNFFENDILVRPVDAIFIAVSSIIYLGGCFLAHRRFKSEQQLRFPAFCQKVNRFAAVLLAVPIYFFVRSHPASDKAPIFTMLLCAIAGILAAASVYGIPRIGSILTPREGKRRLLPLLLIVGFAALWATVIIQLEYTHHMALGTLDWDFGLYINTMWHSIHGNLLGCSLNSQGNHAFYHFDPILILLSPVLLIYPAPESLIVLQGVWVASGAIPLYLLASRYAKNEWMGVAMAIVYLLHPALHGPSVYDFHSLMLAGPLMLWSMHFLEAGATRRFFVFFSLLLLTREEMTGIGFFIGLYAFISGKSRKVALVAMGLSVIYGLVIYFAVMQHAHSYSGYFKDMHGAKRSVVANIVITSLKNPLYMLNYMLSEKKLTYILQLIVPLLFLPIFAPKHRVLYLSGLGVTLLSTKDCLTNISMQYSTWWLPFMFAAVPTAVDRLSKGQLVTRLHLNTDRTRMALVAGLLMSAFTMSAAYGIFWPNPSFRAGYGKLIRNMDEKQLAVAETVAKIKTMIPPDASVMTSNHLGPHFSLRDWIWSIDRSGYRVGEPDFAIVRKKDLRSKKDYKVKARKKNLEYLNDRTKYRRILRENGITVYQRKSAEE